jgi:biotin transport system substrate-specific component
LQTLAVPLIAAAFGLRLGVATVLLYLAQGAAGFPVFQSTPEKGIGIAYMLGTTGGYLAGFVVMAAIVGWAADRGWDRSIAKFFGAVLVAEVIMMAMGFAWLAVLIGPEKSWQFGVLPFIVPDLIKVALVTALVPAVWALLPKR